MRAFLALTFYFSIVKKGLLKSCWSTNSVLITPFPRTVMSRVDFDNILSFLYCCNNAEYISKGQPGHNQKRKFGEILSTLKEKFSTLWTPREHISIDEGTVPFKGNIHFRVYNPNKPDKYGIKTICWRYICWRNWQSNCFKVWKNIQFSYVSVRKLQETRIYSTYGLPDTDFFWIIP